MAAVPYSEIVMGPAAARSAWRMLSATATPLVESTRSGPGDRRLVSGRRAPHAARSGYVNDRGILLPGQQLRRPVRRPSVFADQPFAAAPMGSEQDAETSGDSVHLQIVDVEIERPGWSSAAGHAGEAIAR